MGARQSVKTRSEDSNTKESSRCTEKGSISAEVVVAKVEPEMMGTLNIEKYATFVLECFVVLDKRCL